jgi:hypothetical protein
MSTTEATAEATEVLDDKGVVESMEEIDAANDVQYAMIQGFEPGRPFRIGSLTAGDLIEWTEANQGEAKRTAGLRLITKSLVNSKNERYAADPKNIAIFRRKSHKVTQRIVEEILKLNGLEVEEQAVKKD